MDQHTEFVHDNDSHAVPLREVQAAIERMEYASAERVMFRGLYLTGCRIQELDRWDPNRIYGRFLYWPLGKNQRSWRKEELPADYIEELRAYRLTHHVPAGRVFGILAETFVRYFNRDIRPILSPAWRQQRLTFAAGTEQHEYVLQLKGLRKDFQTINFAREYARWKDAGVALEFTSKRMRHSSKNITAYHYIENFDALGIKTLSKMDPKSLLEQHRQTRLLDFTTRSCASPSSGGPRAR